MPTPVFIKKNDRAWTRRLRELTGEAPKPRKPPAPSLGLLGRRIAALTPEQRVEVERLVGRLLSEQEQEDDDAK